MVPLDVAPSRPLPQVGLTHPQPPDFPWFLLSFSCIVTSEGCVSVVGGKRMHTVPATSTIHPSYSEMAATLRHLLRVPLFYDDVECRIWAPKPGEIFNTIGECARPDLGGVST